MKTINEYLFSKKSDIGKIRTTHIDNMDIVQLRNGKYFIAITDEHLRRKLYYAEPILISKISAWENDYMLISEYTTGFKYVGTYKRPKSDYDIIKIWRKPDSTKIHPVELDQAYSDTLEDWIEVYKYELIWK